MPADPNAAVIRRDRLGGLLQENAQVASALQGFGHPHRRVIETGAAELAALRRTDDDLRQLESQLAAMSAAAEAGDVDACVLADISFHQTVLDAANNAFVSALLEPLSRLLIRARRQTSQVADIRAHAIEHHRAVLEALREGDPDRARRAMYEHIDQTQQDLRGYVLRSG